MRVQCPFCNYIMKTDDAYVGLEVECPGCGNNLKLPATNFEAGCVIGDFIIKEKIGEGSIAAVFKATQQSLERTVALKILFQEYTNNNGVANFLKEARSAAKLSHPNLVQALAVGEENGVCYMAMNFISGETLKNRLQLENRLNTDEALHIIQQVAEALCYAWEEANMVHRDIKPDNIMITDEGVAKLTDLGLAMPQSDWHEDMQISGSPSYMSPEQFAGKRLDPRSDIYSLGVTLYQMLTGELPFKGTSIKVVARQHFEDKPTPIHKLNKKVSLRVSALVKKMIEKLPDDRFFSMEELLEEIWTIRQTTAPDKNLIPDVHTISINRLNYNLQNESLERQKIVKEELKVLEGKNKKLKWIITAIFTVIIGLVFLTIMFMRPGRDYVNFQKQINVLKSKIEARELSPKAIDTYVQKLQRELPVVKNKREKALYRQLEIIGLKGKLSFYDSQVKYLQEELKKAQLKIEEYEDSNSSNNNLQEQLNDNKL
ncbi:serine/threonine-protein kinase [Lentisphaerota bacterium WC36G]|nr:serine/threonine protein kinase [Lentisphaerae bacterium WC36]